MNKLMIYIMMFFLMIGAVNAVCNTPTNNNVSTLSLANSVYDLCTGSYTNVTHIINANNVTLNCNSSTIVSDVVNTRLGVDTNFNNNYVIKNCIFINFSNGIYMRSSINGSVINNSFIQRKDSKGIQMDRNRAFLINNNNFSGNRESDQVGIYGTALNFNSTGIYMTCGQVWCANGTISNNFFKEMKLAIRINNNATLINITYNRIHNISSWQGYAILIDEEVLGPITNINIGYNNITRWGWDGIVTRNRFTNVYFNRLEEGYHHAIDTLIVDNDEALVKQEGNNYYNNYIQDTIRDDISYNTSRTCALLTQIRLSSFYNNYCNNTVISVYGNESSTYSINVTNNTINNAEGFGIYHLANNSLIKDNTIINVTWFDGNEYEIIAGAALGSLTDRKLLVNQTYKNNYNPSGVMRYLLVYNGTEEIRIEDTSTVNMSIDMPTSSGILYFPYSGTKNITINAPLDSAAGITVTDISLNKNYKDIWNITNYIYANVNSINTTQSQSYSVQDGGCDVILVNNTIVTWNNIPCFPSINTNGSYYRNNSLNITANVLLSFNLSNFLISYPFNDLRNNSNNVLLNNNFDNLSLSLVAGQSVSVGNFSFFNITLVTYPSGTLFVDSVNFNITIADPDGIYKNTTIYLTDLALLPVTNFGSAALPYVDHTFAGLSDGYYLFRVVVFDNQSSSAASGYYQFRILTSPPGVANNCSGINDLLNGLVIAMSILMVLGVIAGFIFMGPDIKMIVVAVIMTILLVIIMVGIVPAIIEGLC